MQTRSTSRRANRPPGEETKPLGTKHCRVTQGTKMRNAIIIGQVTKSSKKSSGGPVKGNWTLPHGIGATVQDGTFTGASPQLQDQAAETIEVQPDTPETSIAPGAPVFPITPGSEAEQDDALGKKETATRAEQIQSRRYATRASARAGEKRFRDILDVPTPPATPGSLTETQGSAIFNDSVEARANKKVRAFRGDIILKQVKVEDSPGNGYIATSAEAKASLETEESMKASPSKKARNATASKDTIVAQGDSTGETIVVKDVAKQITVDASETLDPDFKMRVKKGTDNVYGLTIGYSPYPHRSAPTTEACEEVHRILTEMHGEVVQPAKPPTPSLEVAGCGEVPSVLDALLRTLISGNTLMSRADAAIKSLAEKFGILTTGIGAGSIDWEKVRLSPLEDVVEAVRPAGCAGIKGAHIKTILDMVYEENLARAKAHVQAEASGTTADLAGAKRETRGQKNLEIAQVEQHVLSLDHLHSMTKDEAVTSLLRYPGIGVKTAACVVLFCLRIPCFAVDTHVHRFCRWLRWVPVAATELDAYNHGEVTVPDNLKYALHQLFIRHGQQCFKCRKATRPGTDDWEQAPECPLEHLLLRDKEEGKANSSGSPAKKRRRSLKDSPDEAEM